MASASRATLPRKSVSVPKTSKNSALTDMGHSRSRRVHSFRLEHLGGGRPRQRLDQGLGGVAVLGIGAVAGGIDGVVLDLRRQRTDQRDPFDRQDLADLVDAELGLAVGDVLGDRPALDQFSLGLYLGRDPEL